MVFAVCTPTSSAPIRPRAHRGGDPAQITDLTAGLAQGLAHNGGHPLYVRATRHLGNDAAISLVDRVLRVHHGRQHTARRREHGSGRVVTGSLDGKQGAR